MSLSQKSEQIKRASENNQLEDNYDSDCYEDLTDNSFYDDSLDMDQQSSDYWKSLGLF